MFRPALIATVLLLATLCARAQEEVVSQQATVRRAVFKHPTDPTGAPLPAALAVHLGESASFLWNTEDCRMLALWSGGFLKEANEGVFSSAGKMVTVSSGPSPISVAVGAFVGPEFHGFELDEEGVPTFQYLAGNLSVSEKISLSEEDDIVEIQFSIHHSPTSEVMLVFPEAWEKLAKTSAGKWKDGYLIVPKEEAADFTISLPLSKFASLEGAGEETEEQKPDESEAETAP